MCLGVLLQLILVLFGNILWAVYIDRMPTSKWISVFFFYLWTKNFCKKIQHYFYDFIYKINFVKSWQLYSASYFYRSPFKLILFFRYDKHIFLNIYGVYVWWKVKNTEKLEMIRFMNLYKRQTKHIKKKHVSSNVKHHHLYLLPFFCLFFFPRKVVITYR